MADYKMLIPSFGCKDGQAIISDDGKEYDSNDILELARIYSDNGGDGLLIYDLSETDIDHEKTIGMIKEVARAVDIPLITGGRVKRLEDVKKYLYAGASAIFLNAEDDEQIDLIKEAADRFGNEKIYMYITQWKTLERVPEFVQLGATMMIYHTKKTLDSKELLAISKSGCNFLITCNNDVAGTMTTYLKTSHVEGVILTVPEEAGTCMNRKQELKARGILVNIFESAINWEQFKLGADGLIPVIVQDYQTQEVLMLAYMNEESYGETLRTGTMTYYSRSRSELWCKGDTSGHVQYVKSLSLDCDNDTILAKVKQIGVACHTGATSCFFQKLVKKDYKESNPLKVFEEVFAVILDRKEHPKEGSYTNYLFDKGIDKILKKIGEEATEIVIAAKNPDPEEIKYEISDFLYHVMVLMAEKGVTWEEITEELGNR